MTPVYRNSIWTWTQQSNVNLHWNLRKFCSWKAINYFCWGEGECNRAVTDRLEEACKSEVEVSVSHWHSSGVQCLSVSCKASPCNSAVLAPFSLCYKAVTEPPSSGGKKPSVLQPVFIHCQTIPSGSYTMVHSTHIVLPHLSLYEEQSCSIPAFILSDCRPSSFCLLTEHASSDTSSPSLNHYNLISFALKVINQNWVQDMKCDLLSVSQCMTLIFCSMHLMTKSQGACYW